MERIVFLNGTMLPAANATISIMDRGFTFADGIYEVSAVIEGALVDNDRHLARLDRSLKEIGIANPYPAETWRRHQEELVARNALAEGLVYMQVTRGMAERDFGFPPDTSPTIVMFTQVKTILASPEARSGVSVITVPDLRWKRRDIKSVGLLAQVLAKQSAHDAGAYEALMVEDGLVTEGSSSTAFILTREGRIVTRQLSQAVLPGITRMAVLDLAGEQGLGLDERPFSVEEAKAASEVFITSATSFVMPVVSVDGVDIDDGRPGARTLRLRELYIERARASARR
jgi:D-alanine transaminase